MRKFRVDAVPKIVNAINHSICRVTGMRPIDVNPSNAHDLWERVFRKDVVAGGKEPKFSKMDAVRISKAKQIFDKGYMPSYSDEIFLVDSTNKGDPNYYTLKDHKGEPIEGRFYPQEFSKTRLDEDTTYRIEKVLRKRTRNGVKEIYVKFKGYPDLQWIKESSIV